MARSVEVIATLPPHVDHRRAIIAHPRVDALRFNTISPLADSRAGTLTRLAREAGAKPLWIDLKGRQLRITRFAYLPYAYVQLSHRIRVDLPVDVHFRDGVARAVENVGGDKLILARRPPRVVGEGEPVNILHPSLAIEGTLTDGDREYVAAAAAQGLHRYLLSFVERAEDIDELRGLDPDAVVVAKIESLRGLAYARAAAGVALMAARDDLFIALGADKSGYVPALETVIAADPDAIAASRILESLERGPEVAAADLADLALLVRLGYRRFMLGDALCFQEAPFRAAMAVLERLFPR